MALRATDRSKMPATRDGLAKSTSAMRAAAVAARAIPLKLAPLVAPYRKHGRLSLRVEHMRQLARFSRGRNNGDGSWSLATDELDDLEYLSPDGIGDSQTLSIRIIALDQDGTTLAILEVPLSSDVNPAGAAQGESAGAAGAHGQDAEIQRQRAELNKLKAALAERDADLAKMRQAAQHEETQLARQKIASELASGRENWKRELEEQLAASSARSASTLEQSRTAWQAEQSSLIAKSEKRAEERLAEAQERWRRESREAMARAETTWKAAEATRLGNAQAGWQEKSARALLEATARCERAEAALTNERAQAKAAVKTDRGEVEVRRLGEQLATLRGTLADRDAALAQTRLAAEQAQERSRQESETALSKALGGWKIEEAARLAMAETQWRKQSAASQVELTTRCERAETALSEVRAQIVAAAKPDRDEGEYRRLHEELAAVRAALADSDAALAQERLATEQARDFGQRDSETALSGAKADWKEEETARLAAAEAQWRKQSEAAQAELAARCERAETALSDARGEAAAMSAQGEGESHHLRQQLATLNAAIADRDTALVQIRSATEQARERWREESAAALSKAKADWTNEEGARSAAAEAQWRQQSAGALAEATARYKQAETALAQIRIKSGAGREQADGDLVGRLRGEIAVLQAALTDRETETVRARPATEPRDGAYPQSRIALRENHDWDGEDSSEPQAKAPGHLIRDVVLVAAFAASVIVFWPRIESFIPESWRTYIPGLASENGTASNSTSAPAEASAPVAAPSAERHMATIVHAVNVRADPAKAAAIVLTLQRGQEVETIGQRNNWTQVRIGAGDGKAKSQQGWVYSSFLKDEADSDKTSPSATHGKSNP